MSDWGREDGQTGIAPRRRFFEGEGYMKLNIGVSMLLAGFLVLARPAYSINCSGLPTQFKGNEFPNGDFFSNFNNPCYLIPLATSQGAVGHQGDLNSVYYTIYFKVDPRYQLIIVGAFPNARYLNVAPYDDHLAPIPYLTDTNIVPLTSKYINPYQPGVAFVAGQQYAVPINFGGTPGTIEPGCSTSAYNVDVNALDGTQRHLSMNWNTDAGFFQKNPTAALHIVDTPQHTNPNTAGMVHVRTYLNSSAQDPQTVPHVIVRDVAYGCAYPAAYALQTLQIVTTNAKTAETSWIDTAQEQDHVSYENNYVPQLCFGVDPANQVAWERGAEYVAGTGLTDGYISGSLPTGLPQTLAAAGEVLRVRLRLPTTPPTPCTNGCSRSGNEQARYMSLTFVNFQQTSCGCNQSLASLADTAFTKDSNGYATLIVGTGASIPSWITAGNGYTFLDLTKIAGYQQFNNLVVRNILPASTFNCSDMVIPYLTEGYTPRGNMNADYLPVVDYPVAATLPTVATPLVRSQSCGIFPAARPAQLPNCGVRAPLPIGIAAVSTQCAAPGCNQVVVQAQPPITIMGNGFGLFSKGLPYTGTSNYLQITDTTQGWDAGYGADQCNVTIWNWTSNIISLTPNVNQGGACPLAAGDQLQIKVWNPQTGSSATTPTTVAAN
jgi:hypothetical protein